MKQWIIPILYFFCLEATSAHGELLVLAASIRDRLAPRGSSVVATVVLSWNEARAPLFYSQHIHVTVQYFVDSRVIEEEFMAESFGMEKTGRGNAQTFTIKGYGRDYDLNMTLILTANSVTVKNSSRRRGAQLVRRSDSQKMELNILPPCAGGIYRQALKHFNGQRL